jgi:hypothetical protein
MATQEDETYHPAKKRKPGPPASGGGSSNRTNCRVALPGWPVAKREVFDCRRVDPPTRVELRTVRAVSKARIAKKGPGGAALVRPGDELCALAVVDPGTPLAGQQIWVARGTEAAVGVDVDTAALAADWGAAVGGVLCFELRERGLVRKNRQATGTRMKSGTELIDCFCLEFDDGKPLWVAGSYLNLAPSPLPPEEQPPPPLSPSPSSQRQQQ